jgi:hypothetical protein
VPGRTFDWRGVATSAEPLVALILLQDIDGPFWAKSGRPHIGLRIRLRLGWYDNAGLDVQVSFSVGGGWRRSRTFLSSTSVLPEIPGHRDTNTSHVVPFTIVPGSPSIACSVLFLGGAFVETGRNGLWRVRKQFVSSIPEYWREILSRGRTGRLCAA